MADAKKYTIIIVDDEESLTKVIKFNLEREGFNTRAYTNPNKFKMEFRSTRQPYDLLITDSNFPGYSGPSLANFSKENYPHIPVIIISGSLRDESVKGQEDAYLEKPFSFTQLSGLVKRMLENPSS
jgi:DNA-binding NtrC family response regulator